MKYKVGDKVKITWSGDLTIVGEVGTIYACDEANGYLVKLDNKNIEHRERGYFLTEYIENTYKFTTKGVDEVLNDICNKILKSKKEVNKNGKSKFI